MDLAAEQGYRVTTAGRPAQRGGTVSIDVPHAYEVSRELIAREFIVDYRPGAGIRVSPHFYTKDEELDATVQEISKILETKAYEKHTPPVHTKPRVT
jgi:kynureninase